MTTMSLRPAPTCRSPTTRRPRRRSQSADACNSSPFQWILALKGRIDGARRGLQCMQARAKIQISPISGFSRWVAHICTILFDFIIPGKYREELLPPKNIPLKEEGCKYIYIYIGKISEPGLQSSHRGLGLMTPTRRHPALLVTVLKPTSKNMRMRLIEVFGIRPIKAYIWHA